MNYIESIEYIESFKLSKTKLGLQNFEELINNLCIDINALKYIHIAGTNGKGSITKMTANILEYSGYKVGIFVSPYIINFRERIQINNEFISENDLARITTIVKEKIDRMLGLGYPLPTQFEVITAIGFYYFCEKQVDFVCLEVGLGGKNDCTNIIKNSLVSVIANIGMDHMEILGDTIEKIALDKAGIIKKNNQVVLYPGANNVRKIIEQECKKNNSFLTIPNINLLSYDNDFKCENFLYKGIKYRKKLYGEYQIFNAITAIEVANILMALGYNITDEDIKKGILNTTFPARFEIVKEKPEIILDGAHNEQGVNALIKNLSHFREKKVSIMLGVMQDKSHKTIANLLQKVASEIILVENNLPRCLKCSEFIKDFDMKENVRIGGNIENYLPIHLQNMANCDILIICGSLYIVSEAREIIMREM